MTPDTPDIQTRYEHSRSLEDAETFKALQTLAELGAVIPLSSLEANHGRLKMPDEEREWSVDPTFANGSNDSGNSNINSRPTLYTSNEAEAEAFAIARLQEEAAPDYWQSFRDQVASYTPAQKKEWLDRINRDLAEQGGRVAYTEKDLEKFSLVRDEGKRLEGMLNDEERNRIWMTVKAGRQTEIRRIVSEDPDAVILDFDFNSEKLSESDKAKFTEATRRLVIPLAEGSPVDFGDKNVVTSFIELLRNKAGNTFLTNDDILSYASELYISENVALQLGSARNAQLLVSSPGYLASMLIKSKSDITYGDVNINGEVVSVPINTEYVERLFRLSHIVGVRQPINSTTVNRRIISYTLFDLEKVNTPEEIEDERKVMAIKLGGIASKLDKMPTTGVDADTKELLSHLTDAYVKPENLVSAASKIGNFGEIYAADAGNWEGFTLAEHTETVLRNFDENFADHLPVELLAPLRLALLAHDLGKPVAMQKGGNQKDYNAKYAAEFFKSVGLDDRTSDLLLTLAGKGAELAYLSDIRGSKDAKSQLRQLASSALGKAFDSEAAGDQDAIDGFIGLCRIIVTCDGGAYTSMAITRRSNSVRFRNAPSFNRSFEQPNGFGKRNLKISKKRSGMRDAPPITRTIDEPSRIRFRGSGAAQKPPKVKN